MADEASGRPTEERILLAAVEAASIHGVTRLSVADVAKRAGLSRPTLYKHFPSKEALVAAAVLREARAVTDAVLAAAAVHDEPREALGAGVLTALRLLREHPLLDRIMRTEPEVLVPLLTTDSSPVLAMARGPVEQMVGERFPALDVVTVRRVADLLVRLIVSYGLSAPDDPPEVVAAVITGFLTAGAIAATGAAPTPEVR